VRVTVNELLSLPSGERLDRPEPVPQIVPNRGRADVPDAGNGGQRAHLRLLHRLGPAATYDAVLTGFLICGHRWDQDADQPDEAHVGW
jgi:hypothetical protein